jgi:hypothetical protein
MEDGCVKNICIYLMKVNRWYYLLLGAFMTLLFFAIKKEARGLYPESDIFDLIMPFALFGIFFTLLFARHMFYSNEEIRTQQANGCMDPHIGHVFGWDNYFPIKINTELTWIKRLCGYVYVVLGSIVTIFFGYLLAVIAIILFTN